MLEKDLLALFKSTTFQLY